MKTQKEMIQDLKWIILEEAYKKQLKEAKFPFAGKKFIVRYDTNINPTKKGIKIQFTPLEGFADITEKKNVAAKLQGILNDGLAQYDLYVDYDTDVPNPVTIGFTIRLALFERIFNKILTKNQGNGGQQAQQAQPENRPEKNNNSQGVPSK